MAEPDKKHKPVPEPLHPPVPAGTKLEPAKASPPGGNGLAAHTAAHELAHAARPAAAVDTTITDHERHDSVEMLHAEEIFRDVPANTVAKKQAFNRLNKAVHAVKKAERVAATAKTPKAEAALAAARAEVVAATEGIKAFIVDARLGPLKRQLKAAIKRKDAAKILELKEAIATRQDELHTEVENMKHTDAGHTDESVFTPIATDVTHHDFVFADGEHVRVRDHVVAYATTVPFGVDSEGATDHAQVRKVMATAGLSASRRKILQEISGFEGGFDTVNTYDRAKVTWGFVQWTGGSESDLTQTLTIIKRRHPDAFAKSFQAYGIDVVRDQLVITPPGGGAAIKGDEAAKAIMKNPRLAAVLAHAGRNQEIQKGEVEAAAEIEIDHALSMRIPLGTGKHAATIAARTLITSEYGVGVLANTFVHSGSGTAKDVMKAALAGYLAKHPYIAGNEAWRAGAEAVVVKALGAHDSDRAASLRKRLSTDAGSFH